uniref:Ku domain-containing protein n=1 Tax=Parastrongyloides trichosuri TaxID=131310 RepID=A0A0N5A2B9_PARTI
MSILQNNSYVFFDGSFVDSFSFNRGKIILEKVLTNKILIQNKEFIQLHSNMRIPGGFKRLYATNENDDFFDIKKIMHKINYSMNAKLYDDIFLFALRAMESGEIEAIGKKNINPINFFFISDLSNIRLGKEQILKFISFMPKAPILVYVFCADKTTNVPVWNKKQLLFELVKPMKCFTFEESHKLFKYFDQHPPKILHIYYDFQISRDFYIPLKGYLNQPKTKDYFTMKAIPKGKVDNSLKRKFVYTDDSNNSKVEGEHIIKAYRYGTKLIPFNFMDEEYFSLPKENKCLQLIQFAPRKEIDLAYLQGPVYHMYINSEKNVKAATISIELVKGMIDCDVVAIAKRVHVNKARPKIVIMYPHYDKSKKYVMFSLFLSIFKDDIELVDRTINTKGSKILTTDEVDLMDSYIDAMTLPSTDNRFKPEFTYDPYYQNKLAHIVSKAHGEDEQELFDKICDVENMLTQDPEISSKCSLIEEQLLKFYGKLEPEEDI